MTELIRQIHSSATVYRLGWTLLHTLWIGAAVAALLAAAMVLLRRRSANARYLAACAALGLLALSPIATFLLVPAPAAPEAVAPPALAIRAGVPMPLPPVAHAAPAPAPKPEAVPSAPPAPVEAVESAKPPLSARVSAAIAPAMPWLVLAWAAGVCLLSLRQLGGWIAAGRLKRLATAPPRPNLAATVARLARSVGVSRPVRVLESVLVKVPGAIGWLKPVILLPAGLTAGLSPGQIEAILIHELIHVRRWDYLVNLVQSLIETLLFYHPAVWFLSGRIRTERENCCDDLVLAAGAEPVSYAESLLHVARRSVSGGLPVAAVAATGRPSHLRTRIARLLGIGEDKPLHAIRTWPVALLLIAAILVGGSVWITAYGEPATPAAPPAEAKPEGAASKTIELGGKVVDDSGRAVAGARVTVMEMYDVGGGRPGLKRLGEHTGTGADGAFRIAVPVDPNKPLYAVLLARKDGLSIGWATSISRTPANAEGLTIRLGRPASLGGVVVDEAGAPVAGAELRAFVMSGQGASSLVLMGLGPVNELRARTDAQGRFEVRDLPEGSTASFLVTAAGKASRFTLEKTKGVPTRLQYDVGRNDVRIVLTDESRIEGRAIDQETGKPVGGVKLVATPMGASAGGVFDKLLSAPCHSGPDGRFTLAGLPEGRYEIGLMPKELGADGWVAMPVQVRTASGVAAKADLQLTHGGTLEVAVRDERGGKPIENAYVSIAEGGSGKQQGAGTGPDGVARFRLVPGRYRMAWVRAEGRKVLSYQIDDPGFAVALGKTHRVDVALKLVGQMRGTVRDEAGTPVCRAVVALWGSRNAADTDAEGKFSLPEDASLAPGRKALLFVRHVGKGLGCVVEVAEVTKPVTATAEPAAELAGTVVGPEDKPIAGAKVLLYLWSEQSGSGVGPRSIRTDKDGRYRIEAVPSWERYSVTATADGFGEDYANVLRPDPAAGTVEVDRITLRPANLSISGTVVDGKGAALPGARIWISGPGQANRHGQADEQGRFRIDGVCAGEVRVQAQAGQVSDGVQARAGQRDVKVVLAKGTPGRIRNDTVLPETGPKIGDAAPDFEVKTLDGKTVKLSDYRGRYVLLDFWATWCGPCVGETPNLKAVYKAFGADKRFVMIALSLDGDMGSPQRYVKKNGLKWIQGFLGDMSKSNVAKLYGVRGIPEILLVGPDGKVVARDLRGGAILEAVAEAMGKDGRDPS